MTPTVTIELESFLDIRAKADALERIQPLISGIEIKTTSVHFDAARQTAFGGLEYVDLPNEKLSDTFVKVIRAANIRK